eukprot:COSAG03_NODE_23240_length_281_cov_1.785714_1_plen_36_part_10
MLLGLRAGERAREREREIDLYLEGAAVHTQIMSLSE